MIRREHNDTSRVNKKEKKEKQKHGKLARLRQALL